MKRQTKKQNDPPINQGQRWLLEVVGGAYTSPAYDYAGPDWRFKDGAYHHPRAIGPRTLDQAIALQMEWMQPGYAETIAQAEISFRQWISERHYTPPPPRRLVHIYDPEEDKPEEGPIDEMQSLPE